MTTIENVENPLSDFAVFAEKAISALNINPILTREGVNRWSFLQGSSQITFFVFNEYYLHATSRLNEISSSKTEELYSYLLSGTHYPYKLGIYDNKIVITYRVHISGILSERSEKMNNNFTNLALLADKLDDFFEKEFQCPKTQSTIL